jgi:ADP-ribosyl-[dinitrogen reductase] hydrolase
MKISRSDRIIGGMWGLLVGDALGVPYEFKSPEKIPGAQQIEIASYHGVGPKSYAGVPLGTWSDDGAGALALADACASHPVFNVNAPIPVDGGALDATWLLALGENLRAWLRSGRFAVDERVFDVGNATRTAIMMLDRGVSPRESGGTGESTNGNGSLMRALPLALVHRGDAAELVRDAEAASAVTHAHPISTTSCALYSLVVRYVLDGVRSHEAVWKAEEKIATLRPAAWQDLQRELARYENPSGSGYVVDSLAFALQCALQEEEYARGVRAAVKLGSDTDTTAAIAGGLLGVMNGVEGIPARWLSAMRGKETADPIVTAIAAAALP